MKLEKKYLPSIFILFLIIGIYFQQLVDLVLQWWDDPNYGHGFLIPLVSIYLCWGKRDILKGIALNKCYPGLIILIIGLIFCIIGTAAAEFFTVRFSFVLVILGTILFFYGKEFTRQLWFPILFLIFMIPIPYVIYYAITFPMQLLSTNLASGLLKLFGLPILSQGNIIHLPNYSLEVVEACSGLRSLMTLSALGAAMAYMTQPSFISGSMLFLFSVPIAIGANVIRICITVIGALLISPKFAEGFLHEISGLVVFIVGFACLGLTGIIIKWIAQIKDNEPEVN